MRAVDRCSPTVGHRTIRGYRIRARESGRRDVGSCHSYEELSCQMAVSIKGETTYRSEVPDTDDRSGGVQTVAAVECGVGASRFVLCLNPGGKAKHDQCEMQKPISWGHVLRSFWRKPPLE